MGLTIIKDASEYIEIIGEKIQKSPPVKTNGQKID
jgi:hypothetical protein